MFASFDDYCRIYGAPSGGAGDGVDEARFARLSWDAVRLLESALTDARGVCRLREFPPVGEDALEAICRCVCAMVRALYRIELCESAIEATFGMTRMASGLRGSVIASVSAGNEFVSYRNPETGDSLYSRAAHDRDVRDRLLYSIALDHLRGVCGSDGVPLLYCGD